MFRYHLTSGVQYLASDNFEQALFHFREERRHQDVNKIYLHADIAYRLGLTHLGLGQPNEAIKELETAIQSFKNDHRGNICRVLIQVAGVCQGSIDQRSFSSFRDQLRAELPEASRADFDRIVEKYLRFCQKRH